MSMPGLMHQQCAGNRLPARQKQECNDCLDCPAMLLSSQDIDSLDELGIHKNISGSSLKSPECQ